MVERRVLLLRSAGRVELGQLDHAPEEEPRRRGAAPRQGAARGRASRGAARGDAAPPLTDNSKDSQEDKEHLFDACYVIEQALAAANGHDRGCALSLHSGCAEASADELIAATDVADLLVTLGVPFREAHGVVAGLVRTALDSDRRLSELRRG